MSQTGFAPIILIFVIAMVLGIGILGGFMLSNSNKDSSTRSSGLISLPSLKNSPEPSPTIAKANINVTNITETHNGVTYTTDVPTFTRFNFWFDPALVNTSYGDGRKTEHNFSPLEKGVGYQILIYDKDPLDGTKSDIYYFSGNQLVYDYSNPSSTSSAATKSK